MWTISFYLGLKEVLRKSRNQQIKKHDKSHACFLFLDLFRLLYNAFTSFSLYKIFNYQKIDHNH